MVNKADLGTMGNIAFNALQRPALQVDDHPPRRRPCRRVRDAGSTIDGVGSARPAPQKIIRSLFSKVPLKLNVTITGPFRALIADRQVRHATRAQMIGDVLPRPLEDVPGHHHRGPPRRRTEEQTQTPRAEQVDRRPATQSKREMSHETRTSAAPGCSPQRCCRPPLGGCISVKAPDKPIEINLNVTIRQEVLVRLQRDVEQLINQNPQAFPQTPKKP